MAGYYDNYKRPGEIDHHHHHHAPKNVVPDYKIYKVENCPELVRVQKELAKLGLKDPWLRNEAWRFNPKERFSASQKFKMMFGNGFKIGFTAFAITIAAETVMGMMSSELPHDHGHH